MNYSIENDGATIKIKSQPGKTILLLSKKLVREISIVNTYTVKIDMGENYPSMVFLNVYDVINPIYTNASDLGEFLNGLLSA
jgi:hypothetical protein